MSLAGGSLGFWDSLYKVEGFKFLLASDLAGKCSERPGHKPEWILLFITIYQANRRSQNHSIIFNVTQPPSSSQASALVERGQASVQP